MTGRKGEFRRPSPHLIVFTLWLLVFSSASQTMIISPILPQIGDQLGIPDAALGTLVSAYTLMVGLFAILAGPVSDKFGRRRILLLGCGTMTVALVLHGFVTSYTAFLAVRVFAGMAGGMLSGAAVSYIGDYFPYHRRGWATGWVMSGSAVGQIVGIPLGIVLSSRWGFRAPFWIFAATMAATVVLIFLRVPQPPVKRTAGRLSVRQAAADYLAMLARPEVAWAAAAYFVMFLGISLFTVYLPTWLERVRGVTPGQIATMYLLGGFANVITGPQAGRLSDRVGRRGIILMASVGLSIVMVATPYVVRGALDGVPRLLPDHGAHRHAHEPLLGAAHCAGQGRASRLPHEPHGGPRAGRLRGGRRPGGPPLREGGLRLEHRARRRLRPHDGAHRLALPARAHGRSGPPDGEGRSRPGGAAGLRPAVNGVRCARLRSSSSRGWSLRRHPAWHAAGDRCAPGP